MTWKFLAIQMIVSINKVLLEHNHSHFFMYFLCLLSCYNCIVKCCNRHFYGPQSLKFLPSCSFHKKNVCRFLIWSIYACFSTTSVKKQWSLCIPSMTTHKSKPLGDGLLDTCSAQSRASVSLGAWQNIWLLFLGEECYTPLTEKKNKILCFWNFCILNN